VDAEPSLEGGHGNQHTSTETAAGDLAAAGGFVGGGSSESEKGGDLLDAEGDPGVQIIDGQP
jgi:hypothetical protein